MNRTRPVERHLRADTALSGSTLASDLFQMMAWTLNTVLAVAEIPSRIDADPDAGAGPKTGPTGILVV